MSLQDIQEEQYAIRAEISRLASRLAANERRIEMLAKGGGGGGSGAYPAPREVYAPQAQASRESTRDLASPGARVQAGRSIVANKVHLENHIGQVADTVPSVWEEPQHMKVSPTQINRTEELLRQAFEKHPALTKRATTNPLQGMMSLLNSLDTNHSGKLDLNEFKQVCRMLNFSTTEDAIVALFRRFDLDRSGYVTKDEFCKLLLKEGGPTTKAKSCIAKMREVLALRAGGFPTMRAMGRQFMIIDRDHSGRLSKEEFGIALDILFKAYKVTFSPADKNALFTTLDMDRDGFVDYDEYVRAVRGDMNDFRLGWVQKAFAIFDKDGSGVVNLDDISRAYDVSCHPQVRSGKISAQEAFAAFMNHYDRNHDGTVSLDEFIESYNWVSASIDNDDYFELMIRNAWHISGGEGWSANTSNLRVLVEHRDGSEEIVEIVDDLGLDKNDQRAVMQKLTQQGVKNIKLFKLAS